MPHPRKADPEKYCQYCGERLQRKIINGRLEDWGVFTRRKNCDVLCMAQAMVKEKVQLSAIRKRAENFKETKCEKCNATKNLHLHHMDFNPANNAPANTMTLCGSCHQKWHWANGRTVPKRPKATCTICGNPAEAKGYCMNHWRHFKKYGDPLLTKKSGRSDGTLLRETSNESQNSKPSETP